MLLTTESADECHVCACRRECHHLARSLIDLDTWRQVHLELRDRLRDSCGLAPSERDAKCDDDHSQCGRNHPRNGSDEALARRRSVDGRRCDGRGERLVDLEPRVSEMMEPP